MGGEFYAQSALSAGSGSFDDDELWFHEWRTPLCQSLLRLRARMRSTRRKMLIMSR
jgi:hypothetical protein